jgi:hypothetical protein
MPTLPVLGTTVTYYDSWNKPQPAEVIRHGLGADAERLTLKVGAQMIPNVGYSAIASETTWNLDAIPAATPAAATADTSATDTAKTKR